MPTDPPSCEVSIIRMSLVVIKESMERELNSIIMPARKNFLNIVETMVHLQKTIEMGI